MLRNQKSGKLASIVPAGAQKEEYKSLDTIMYLEVREGHINWLVQQLHPFSESNVHKKLTGYMVLRWGLQSYVT